MEVHVHVGPLRHKRSTCNHALRL